MQRRLASLGFCVVVALGVATFLHAVADNFDPAEKLCAQNLARLGIAALLYVQDYDDRFPLAYDRFAESQPWRWDVPAPVPRDWQDSNPQGGWTWANALMPYLVNRYQRNLPAALSCPATLPVKLPSVDYSRRVRSPMAVSYTYNGYLHSYRLGLVEDPSRLVVIWEGLGREHWIGFAPVNPILRCDRADKACLFTPCVNPATHYPRGEVRLPRQSVWIHRSGMYFVTAEGRLFTRRLGASLAPNNTNPNLDPFTQYNAQGIPSAAHGDSCGLLPFFAPR
ncbi:MAG: hypothetical protein NZ874_04445 [Fimbriimonadales bacterium]|nr:hypothetical protein [Fimbriimonadales bacterium]